MKKIIITTSIACLMFFSCTQEQIKTTVPETTAEIDELHKFLNTCNTDIQKAVKIISENKMVFNLTHLRRMDTGGKKYYLLERENLSSMIMSVTEGTYSDLILINKSGLIIYTMKNDDIFGKNVNVQLKDTVLTNSFNRSKDGFHIEDVSIFPKDSGKPVIFASYPDRSENQMIGVFIIQIDMDIIKSILGKNVSIIGYDGYYRLDNNPENIFKPYEYYSEIELNNTNIKKKKFRVGNESYEYYPFNFYGLSWIIIYKY